MSAEFLLSHLCISSLVWRGEPIDEVAESMMRLGLVHLELSSSHLAPGHYQPDGANSRLFNLLAEAGVSVAVLRLSGMTFKEKLRAIADAGERGIPAVLDRAEKLLFPDLVDRVRTYADTAARAGVHYILDNDFYTSCDNAQAQLSLARAVRNPALGFGFAPLYALADDKDPGEEVRSLGAALWLAHLWDAPVKMVIGRAHEEFDPGPPEDQAPGARQGRVDWPEYFRALSAVKFKGILNLKWLGGGWSSDQTESAIADAVRFCAATADEIGWR